MGRTVRNKAFGVTAGGLAALALHLAPMDAAQAASGFAYEERLGGRVFVNVGAESVVVAEREALEACMRGGGVFCRVIENAGCEQGGYGSIYRRREAYGVACGHGSVARAAAQASALCFDQGFGECARETYFFDDVSAGHVLRRCLNRTPENDPCAEKVAASQPQ